MNFTSAVNAITRLLRRLRPATFCSSWILHHAPEVYRFIRREVRAESGGIDWDRFTRALDCRLQRRWQASRRGRAPAGIKSRKIVDRILTKYNDKLYTFLCPADSQDRQVRDFISIKLVRLAQHGNVAARSEIMKLLMLTIDAWIEQYSSIARWTGRADMIEGQIEGCIRRYRYSGSFMGYLFKTLKYAGRGLRPLVAYSLDDYLYEGAKRRGDRVALNPDTDEIIVYG